jgi:SAM-dependent methyltransferase
VTTLFGQVADSYDDVRPGYPAEITDAIAAYAGAVGTVVELGSGTGKGTEILAGLGAPITCIEPDPRMAALLQARFPHATVTISPFEQWTPPPGGVDLLGCAMAWHWLDPHTRNRHAHDALRPGGTLALFGHSYGFADSSHERAVTDALAACGVVGQIRPQQWLHDDIVASGLWSQVRQEVTRARNTRRCGRNSNGSGPSRLRTATMGRSSGLPSHGPSGSSARSTPMCCGG